MGLSINKLEKLMSENGFIIRRYFILNNRTVHLIEIFSVKDATVFIISVPSNYSFNVKDCQDSNIVNIRSDVIDEKSPDYNEEDNPIVNIAETHKEDCAETYEKINLKQTVLDDEKNVYKKMNDNYKKSFKYNSSQTAIVKEMLRQLKRLKCCVENIPYKLVMFYKNNICQISDNNEVEQYTIENTTSFKLKIILVTIDLNNFYTNISSVHEQVTSVKNDLKKVLIKNYTTHSNNIQELLSNKQSLLSDSIAVFNRRDEYSNHIENFQRLFQEIKNYESELKHKYKNVFNASEKVVIDDKMSKILDLKSNVIKNILILRDKYDHIMLTADNSLFDNILMLSVVFKNFEQITNI